MARRAPVVQLDWKTAALSTEFGREWATKLFGEEAIATLPILKTGKNKGHFKGFVIWRKAVTNGFIPGFGPVAAGQLVDAWIGDTMFTSREHAQSGHWLGRMQPLAGSAGALFQTARDRHVAETVRSQAYNLEIAADQALDRDQTAVSAGYYEQAATLLDTLGQADKDKAVRLRIEAARLLDLVR